jgi:sugar phosphate isomerase/epimerase
MWPGLVGKKSMGGAEPDFDLDTMLDFTAKADVGGVKFDGVDLFVYTPHMKLDISDDDLKALAEKIQSRGLVVGSVVAPVWFFGTAMGDQAKRDGWVASVRKTIRVARKLRELGVRAYGVVRIDSAVGVTAWDADPEANTKQIAATFREAGKIAKGEGERLAAEGEICWGGMHSWKIFVKIVVYV